MEMGVILIHLNLKQPSKQNKMGPELQLWPHIVFLLFFAVIALFAWCCCSSSCFLLLLFMLVTTPICLLLFIFVLAVAFLCLLLLVFFAFAIAIAPHLLATTFLCVCCYSFLLNFALATFTS
jgi:hypothetical protein